MNSQLLVDAASSSRVGVPPPLLVHSVARRLGRSRRTIRHLAATGKLPGFKDGVKIWRFRPADVDDYLARKEADRV